MDPHIAVHGSFSVMVNYHSIGAYFTSRGGFALHNPQEEVRHVTIRAGADVRMDIEVLAQSQPTTSCYISTLLN